MSTKDVLSKARAIYAEKPGRVKLHHQGEGCFCALGAIGLAAGIEVESLAADDYYALLVKPEARAAIHSFAMVVDPHDGLADVDAVYEFNDDETESREDSLFRVVDPTPVLDAFDRAIEAHS